MARRRRRNRGNKSRNRDQQRQRSNGVAFWGDSEKLPELPRDVRVADDPALGVRGLGPPPLPGREVIAEHYLEAVYGRIVGVAGALAVAGGMLDPAALVDDDDEDDTASS